VQKVDAYLLHRPRRLAEDWRTVVGLTLLLCALYLPGLGSYGLYDPWETHYGEVGRNMVETGNYIDPWWGSPWDTADVKREKEGFYSKPLLIMWMMAAGIELVGYGELGVRMFFPPLALLALLSIYLSVSRFFNRRAALLATVVTATAPFFAFLSRQAVTDGPMVSIMTVGVMFLVQGLFLPWGESADDEERQVSPFSRALVATLVAFAIGWQLWAMWPMDRSPDIVRAYTGENPLLALGHFFTDAFAVGRGKGWAIALLLLPLGALAVWRVWKEKDRRLLYVYVFYLCCGLVVPAKGWVEWAPVGIAILLYCAVTGAWGIWTRVRVGTGILIVLMIGHPWIVAMLGGHHPGWYDRFIIHDHVNRIFAGVHSTDDGGFEYFFRWIGFGLFPWIGLLPAAVARCAGGLRGALNDLSPQRRFELFVFLWGLVAFFLFSLSKTKFHHYIFPAIPPFCILVALVLEDALSSERRTLPILAFGGLGVTLWVGQDLYLMPKNYGDSAQNLVNLFTYKYDREWARFTSPDGLTKLTGDALEKATTDNAFLASLSGPLSWVAVLACLGLACLAFRRLWLREYGTMVLGVSGLWMAWFCLHDYLPAVAVSWSQKGMWDTYYAECQKFAPEEEEDFKRHMLLTASRVPERRAEFPRAWCKEPIVAFRTNWRGECYYSANTVVPVPEVKNLKPFLEEYKVAEGRPFYLFTEKGRVKSELEPNLPAWLKGKGVEVYADGRKFTMLRFEQKKPPDPPPPPPSAAASAGGSVPGSGAPVPPSGAVRTPASVPLGAPLAPAEAEQGGGRPENEGPLGSPE
jgi:4-amino-4-deoxy-L-arabinose transferase-like glycosyltransferase